MAEWWGICKKWQGETKGGGLAKEAKERQNHPKVARNETRRSSDE